MKYIRKIAVLSVLMLVAFAMVSFPADNAMAGSYGFDTFKSKLMQINEQGYRDTGVRVLDDIRDLGSGNIVIVFSSAVASAGNQLIGQNIGVMFTLWDSIHNRPPFSVTYYLGSTLIGKMTKTSSGRITATDAYGRPL